ncbi:hypothetical protein DFH08DRAFT_766326, partial [Mycena albidolilacea]
MSVLVDDSDPLVQYNPPGNWTNNGKPPEFNTTTHASKTWGDTATLVFEGTSIGVYGTLAPSTAQLRLNFSIDGTDFGSYNARVVPRATRHQLLWTSPVFEEASHRLVITLDSDPASPNRSCFLDYFVYKTSTQEEGSKTLDTAAIVGGAVGGVITLALISALMLIRRRRARARHNDIQVQN